MFKVLAFLFLAFQFCFEVYAVEPGYQEALEYFVERDKSKPQSDRGSGFDSPNNIIVDPEKLILGFGVGEISDSQHLTFEVGMTFVQSRHFQQSLSLEYLRLDNKSNLDEHTSVASAVFLIHTVQLSSRLFFLSPEIGAGLGRVFDEPLEGSLFTVKAGLVYSNRWRERFLFSAHLYYRRNEYFKADGSGDGIGLTLKFGF